MAGKGTGVEWKSGVCRRDLAPAGHFWPGRGAGHPLRLSGMAHGSQEPPAIVGPLLLPANSARALL